MHLQIGVFDVERQRKPLTLDCTRQRSRDVEIERIAEFVSLGRSAGFDAGRQIARIVPSKARFAQGSQQIPQRLEAQEIETLVGNFKLGLLRFASLPAHAGLPRRIVRLIN